MRGRGFRNMSHQGGWVSIAALVVSGVSAVAGFLGSQKASSAAKNQAQLEAEQEKKLTTEKLRQLGIEERAVYGQTLAQYAGSGVLANAPSLSGQPKPNAGSPLVVLAEQAKEFGFQRKITQEVGATKVNQALSGGKATADYYRYSGYANVASNLSNVFTQWANYNANKGG